MRKVLIFKTGLMEKLIINGFYELNDLEILGLISSLIEVKIKKKSLGLKHLLDSGINPKESLLISCAYELGKRYSTSSNPRAS